MTFREEVGSEGPLPLAAEGGPWTPVCLSEASSLPQLSPRVHGQSARDPRSQRCSGDTSIHMETQLPGQHRRPLSPPLHVPPASFRGTIWHRRDMLVFSFSQRNADGWPEWARS